MSDSKENEMRSAPHRYCCDQSEEAWKRSIMFSRVLVAVMEKFLTPADRELIFAKVLKECGQEFATALRADVATRIVKVNHYRESRKNEAEKNSGNDE